MKKYFAIVPLLVMFGCSSTNNAYDRHAEKEQELTTKSNTVTKKVMPKWFTKLPKVSNAVLAQGLGISSEPNMAIDKARMDAYKSICMTNDGKVDMNQEKFSSDVGKTSVERFEQAIRAVCDKTTVRGVEYAKIDSIEPLVVEDLPNGKWVAYVLIALPTGSANIIQTEHNQQELSKNAAVRADKMFNDMDKR
jgi:hypothetical protein